jgi:hypothetical protein
MESKKDWLYRIALLLVGSIFIGVNVRDCIVYNMNIFTHVPLYILTLITIVYFLSTFEYDWKKLKSKFKLRIKIQFKK